FLDSDNEYWTNWIDIGNTHYEFLATEGIKSWKQWINVGKMNWKRWINMSNISFNIGTWNVKVGGEPEIEKKIPNYAHKTNYGTIIDQNYYTTVINLED